MPPGAVTVKPGAKAAGAIVFMVDGLSGIIVEEMLADGKLPTLKKYFVDRGLYAPRAVAHVPSVTLANITSIATGLLPGHHTVTGNHWFDRCKYVYRNYETLAQKNTLDCDYAAPTVFEMLDDEFTASLFFQANRGSDKWFENWLSAGVAFYLGWYDLVDRVSLYRFKELAELARKRGQWPALTISYLLTPDFCAYRQGLEGPHYRQCLVELDFQLGRVLGDFERAGLLDKLAILLVSDHGMCPVNNHSRLKEMIEDHPDLNVAKKYLWEKTSFADRKKYYDRFSAVVDRTGDRYLGLWLRKPVFKNGRFAHWDDWSQRPTAAEIAAYPAARGGTIDIFKLLLDQHAVEAIAYSAGPNRVRVRRSMGEAEFSQPAGRGGDVTYRLVSGTDPFEWEGTVPAELLAGKPAAPRQWLDATEHTPFPAFIASLLAFFREENRRADVMAFARPDWDFHTVLNAGHGGLRDCEAYIPVMAAGPGIPHGRVSTVRSTDIVPTVLELLGRPIPPHLDGRSILKSNIYHARAADTQPAATRPASTAP
ncbi:MAG: alkaline phosphatase family protein [Planctomycetaceae bacterium]